MTVEGNASDRSAPPADQPPARRRHTARAYVVRFTQAVRDSDQATVDDMIMRLSRARPWLAPLALAVGAFAMLFVGVKLLFTNWRLTLIQVLPAMWIWAAMFDLKAHVVHGRSFHVLTGTAIVVPVVLGVAAVTAAGFYLNAVFAFAIVQPGRPQIRRPSPRPGLTCPWCWVRAQSWACCSACPRWSSPGGGCSGSRFR